MGLGCYFICWVMAALAALAPLPFGSVRPIPLAALQLCLLALALVWITLRRREGLTPLPWTDPLLLTGGVLFIFGLVQMMPMPVGLLRAVAPSSAAVWQTYAPVPVAWAAISIEPYATWRSCLLIACWTLAALMVRHNAVDLKGRLIVAGGVVAGGLFQAGYGLFEFISGRQRILGYRKEFFTDVATGTFVSRNNYAGYLEMAIPLALALAILSLGRSHGIAPNLRRRLAAATGRESFHALLLIMGAFLMATAILMSRSRMGIIATASALVAGGVAMGVRSRVRRFAVASVGVVLLVAVFASQIDILPVASRFRALRWEFGGGYGRLEVWKETLPMLAAYPLFGSGMGTWEDAFSPFRHDTAQVRVDYAHNDYLEFVAEAGLAGVLILAAGTVVTLRRHKQGRAAASMPLDEIAVAAGAGLVAIGLHSLTDFHLSIPADALIVVVLLGLYLRRIGPAATTSPAAEGGRRATARPPASWAVTSAALVVLCLTAVSPAAARIASTQTGPDPAVDVEDADMAAPPPGPGLTAPSCAACLLEPFNGARDIEAASLLRKRVLADIEAVVRSQAAGELPDPAVKRYLAGRVDEALAIVGRGLSRAPASSRGHMEAGLLHFGRFVLVGLPPQASDDFDLARASFAQVMKLQPWRAVSQTKIARMMAPFYNDANEEQQRFIAESVRRAHEIDPSADDITRAYARMGI